MKLSIIILTIAAWAVSANAQPVDVLPVRLKDGARSLNGEWSFKYIPALDAGVDEGFYAPGFDATAWKKTPVPSHWELHGFTEPQYNDDVKEGLGLYRRSFSVPKQWSGQRVFLKFDGVLYGFTAYVNGKSVGEFNSSFNTSTFDITDALSGKEENELAVRVTTRSKGWNFDNMDCWALSGIYRDVEIFALAELHLKDYTAVTTLQPDGTAKLDLAVVASAAADVSGRLISPDGNQAAEFTLKLADGSGKTSVSVPKPLLWTAESPWLYRLEMNLQSAGRTVQTYTSRIGLRQVTIKDGILKLNGSPIKLRGVNHHEIWSEGRVSTEENTRRDLELIRDANINFVRTAHYPPHPRLLEMCDEMGLYVLDEVPFVHGRKHLKDPDFLDTMKMRARATVMRDKNHASVLFWSLGNENPINPNGTATGKYVKELDPTRPIMFPTIGSYFSENYEKLPEFEDIYAPHYPSLRNAREHAEKLTKPIIFTEYAHQRGLARSGVGVQDMWELFYQTPRIAGGAIWVFQDQGILRTTDDRKSVKDGDMMCWLDEHRYYDTRGFYAMDGLVYSDRTPQTDYLLVRKVYSPVQIKERLLAIKPGAQKLLLQVENRNDFRSLSGMKLKWALRRNGASIQDGVIALSAKAKETETVSAAVTLPEELATDVYTLDLRCVDEEGRQIYECGMRLDSGAAEDARWKQVCASLPKMDASLEIADSVISVRHPSCQLKLDRQSGQLTLLGPDGSVLVSAFGPHTGRNPTMNDMAKDFERLPTLWRGSVLSEVTNLKTEARQTPDGIELSVSGTYPRPDKPEESVVGGYKVVLKSRGTINVSYEYTPRNATGEMLEAGFALALPAAQSEFRWLGEGPYAGYSGKDRQNEYGIFHLNREDLYFPGNRRNVELATFARPTGSGLLMSGTNMTLDLECLADTTILSDLAQVPGPKEGKGSGVDKNENVSISSRLNASSLRSISGKFTLLPLANVWPKLLKDWLGSSGARTKVTKPFIHSYDQ